MRMEGCYERKKPFLPMIERVLFGAKDEVRTRDLNLGKVALYQLSYFRLLFVDANIVEFSASVK